MTDKFYKIISVLAVIALFGIGIGLFVGKIEIKDVQKNFLTIDDANIKDRENGYGCALDDFRNIISKPNILIKKQGDSTSAVINKNFGRAIDKLK